MKNKTLALAIAATIFLLGACILTVYSLAPTVSNVAGITLLGGSANTVTESRVVSDFTMVNFDSVGELTVTQGYSDGLTIQAEERILRQIKTEVKNGVLTITAVPEGLGSLNTKRGIYYTVTVRRLDALTLAGAGNIYVKNIRGDRLSITLSGGGTLDVAGEANDQTVILSGAGRYAGGNLKTRTALVNLTGVGSATVWVTDALDATITSVGSIDYYGNPQVKKDVKGLGSVTGLGNK